MTPDCVPVGNVYASTFDGEATDACDHHAVTGVLVFGPGFAAAAYGEEHDGCSGHLVTIWGGACVGQPGNGDCVVVQWFDGEAWDPSCSTYATTPNARRELGCPLGPPPNPGWGRVLP